jgi:DNA repair photolyase
MGLNKQSGNMYGFATHTWNTVKGKCYHDCSYCYMKRFVLKPVRFDEKELNTDLGKDNFIFVGSSCDMFAENIPVEWIDKTIDHCRNYDNRYLFQTKNPSNFIDIDFPENTILCTTVESNRNYFEIYNNSPKIGNRISSFKFIESKLKMITIEPILNFDIDELLKIITDINPFQVNIGADSNGHHLPEPSEEKLQEFLNLIPKNIKVFQKDNLKRLEVTNG